jgi:hypothetical protein
MFRNRSARIHASLLISLSLAVTALAGPGAILAAPASTQQSATAIPPMVTPGADVAFDVRFKNTSTSSNIAQLYLTAKTPANWILLGLESSTQPASCDTSSADLACSLGAVNAGASLKVRVVYTTDANDHGSITVPFAFNTTGATPTGADTGKHSHGDTFSAPGVVYFSTSQDFSGYYITNGTSLEPVSDITALHIRRNPQYTQVNPPEDAIGVTVGEGGTFTCPAATGGTCFGQWSSIYVNDGAPYLNGFSVVLGYKGNIGNASFVHLFDTYDPIDPLHDHDYELIEYNSTDPNDPTDICSSASPSASEIPCMIQSSLNGDSFVTLWLNQNGRLSGY